LSTLAPPDPRTRLDDSPFVQSHRRVVVGPAVITVASLIGVGLMNDVTPAASSGHHFSLVRPSAPGASTSNRVKLASAPIVRPGAGESPAALPALATTVAVAVPAATRSTPDADGIRPKADRALTTPAATPPPAFTPLAPASSAAAKAAQPAATTAKTTVPAPPSKPVVTNKPTTLPPSPPPTGYGVSYVTAGPGGTCNDASYPVKAAHQAYYLPGTTGYSAAPATQCYRSGTAATQAGFSQSTYDPPKPTT
jgi:hypothetical protein